MKYKFNVGEKVLCFEPDETKARVLYNAKIMDADILKDVKGKKHVEYKIHFQGWNHAWDRWASESFVLKDDEQNRKLQRKLARRAMKKLKLQKGRKRHHLPGVATKPESENIFLATSSSDESLDSNISTGTKDKISETEDYHIANKKFAPSHIMKSGFARSIPDDETSSNREEHHPRRAVNVDIPHPLKRRLEEDNMMIKKRDMLLKLPVKPNIVQILDNYVKKFAAQYVGVLEKQKVATASSAQPTDPEDLIPAEKRLTLCQEVCCDLKLLFDYTLPIVLLYSPEKQQYKHVVCNTEVTADESPVSEYQNTSDCYENTNQESVPPSAESEPVSHHKTDLSVANAQSTVSLSESSPSKVHKKKTAEMMMIEETHKYLIPNQPNLDQTGLSKDSQGRRRSSRLSHHDSSPPGMALVSIGHDQPVAEKMESTPGHHKSEHGRRKYYVTTSPYIFLRAPLKPGRSLSFSSLNSESPSVQLFNSNPRMDRETYIFSVGSDMKNLVELKKAWDWSIIPVTYQPEDGATVPPSLVYGIHHLLRLFVKLPEILTKMEIPEFKIKVLLKHLHSLLKFLSEYERELFEVDAYVPSHSLTYT